MPNPQKFSFLYGNTDMLETFGIRIEKTRDALMPKLRERKIIVPDRDGAHDYGAKYYDERIVGFDCVSVSSLTRQQMRELACALSVKNTIRHWREPEKYYVGRIYDASVIELIGQEGSRYPLDFVCDPFANGEQVTKTFNNSKNWTYAGTARTPTRITITNNNAFAVTGITISMREEIQ